LMTTS